MNLNNTIIIDNKEIENKFFIKIEMEEELELFILNKEEKIKLYIPKELIKEIFKENTFNKGISSAKFSLITNDMNEFIDLVKVSSKEYNKLINKKKLNEKNIKSGMLVRLYSGEEVIFLKTVYKIPFHYIGSILMNVLDLSKEIEREKLHFSIDEIEWKMKNLFNPKENNIEQINLFLQDGTNIYFRTIKMKSNYIMKEIRREKQYTDKEKEYELILSELYDKDNLKFDKSNSLEIVYKNYTGRTRQFYCISLNKEDINKFKEFIEDYLKKAKEKLKK